MANTLIQEEELRKEKALYNAAMSGDYKTVNELLKLGVSVELENWNRKLYYSFKIRNLPLQIAAENGHPECVQLLIDHGANVDAKDKYQYTALHLAAKNGESVCLRILLNAGADVCVPLAGIPLEEGKLHVTGTTALHLAAKYNHVNCVKELLNFGADYNAVDRNSHTSLYIAAKSGFDECVLTHLKSTQSPVILSIPSSDTSDTPLHFAVIHEMSECVKELLHLGSDVNHCNRLGFSPIHLACCDVFDDCMRKYICKGSIPRCLNPGNIISKYNKKSWDAKFEILKYCVLKGHNANINAPVKFGYPYLVPTPITALHHSIFLHYNPEIAAFLITYGADINVKDPMNGLTALEFELSLETKRHVLTYLVNCMSQLPRLRSLNLKYALPKGNDFPTFQRNSPFLRKDAKFELYYNKTSVYVEVERRPLPISPFPLPISSLRLPSSSFRLPTSYFPLPSCSVGSRAIRPIFHLPPEVERAFEAYNLEIGARSICHEKGFDQYHLEQPLLNIIYERVVDEIRQLDDIIKENSKNINLDIREIELKRAKLWKLEKCLWYDKMATNPRTLQHCCRFTIRKYMGPSKLKYIRNLPLPEKLISYMLLEECENE